MVTTPRDLSGAEDQGPGHCVTAQKLVFTLLPDCEGWSRVGIKWNYPLFIDAAEK